METLPQRIVVAGRGTYMVTGALFTFPEASERVAAYEGGRFNDPTSFLPLIDPEFEQITSLEKNAGPEQIARSNRTPLSSKPRRRMSLAPLWRRLAFRSFMWRWNRSTSTSMTSAPWGNFLATRNVAREIINFFQVRLDGIDAALVDVETLRNRRY